MLELSFVHSYFIQVLAPQFIAIYALQRRQRSMLEVGSLHCLGETGENFRLEPIVFRAGHSETEAQTMGEDDLISRSIVH